MKHMRKILALALALIMVLGLATTASADNVDVSGHDFVAYQIFSGSQATDGGALGDVKWGTGVNEANLLAALKTNAVLKDIFASCETAAAVAEKLSGYQGTSDVAKEFARVAYANITGEGIPVKDGDTIAAGYYLIVDITDVSGADDVLNLALLEVSSEITIESKVDKPTSQKKVDDKNDSNTTQDEVEWEDSADYDVDDEVPFQLKATLPSDVTSYNKYYLAFHDVQSAGLTFNAETVKVYVDGKQINSGYEVKTATADGCTFEIIIKDVRAVGAGNGSVITVEYTSTLNENAVIGSVGNPNKMNIEYSNNPNQIWDGEGKPDTGETPEDKVIVFTYKVVVNKTDKDGKALEGAGFTLYKKNASGEYVAIGEELKGDTMTTFTWERLDDGDYKLVETTTPAGYNTIDPIEFTITAEHDILSDNPALTKLEGGVLFTGEVSTGALTGDVVNQAGTTLPETGGIGTTLFYVIGGLLVAAAVVLLVTKKRMASAQ